MNVDSLKTMKGEDGSVAIFAAMFDQSNEISSNQVARRAIPEQDSSNTFTAKKIVENATKFSSLISHLPDAAFRFSAYGSLATMLMSAASRTQLAEVFSSSMMKHGHQLTAGQFLSPKLLDIAGNSFINDSVLFSRSDALSLINNTRSLLNEIFVDAKGESSSRSLKAVQSIIKPIENAMSKYGPTSAVKIALKEILNSDSEKLTGKFEEFMLAAGMKPDPASAPAPRNAPSVTR